MVLSHIEDLQYNSRVGTPAPHVLYVLLDYYSDQKPWFYQQKKSKKSNI